MSKQLLQEGVQTVTYTHSSSVVAGEQILTNTGTKRAMLVAIADADADVPAAFLSQGVFRLNKNGSSFSAGDDVYCTTGGTITSSASGNYYVGFAVADAAGGDLTVDVRCHGDKVDQEA